MITSLFTVVAVFAVAFFLRHELSVIRSQRRTRRPVRRQTFADTRNFTLLAGGREKASNAR